MSTRTHASGRYPRSSDMEAEHDEGLAEIMRLTEYLGDTRRAAMALVEKHGVRSALELLDQVIGECNQQDNPNAVEMAAMWMMVRNHIIDGWEPDPVPEDLPPTRN